MEDYKEEHILWEKFRAGDEAAFSSLFYLYSDTLFYYGSSITKDRELIKDSIQQLFCNLWERKEQCPEVSKIKSFLMTALRRIILRKIQQEKRVVLYSYVEEQKVDTHFSTPANSPEEDLIQKEVTANSQIQLRKAIKSLPPRQLEAIHLRYYQGLSYEEMAEVMSVQKGSIGQFIAQAIKALRKKINS